uniref:Uncharacterized protein n=1 Tax=Oryza punctata TaxID=4537 RepID=A0A0E0MBW0_ORYPU
MVAADVPWPPATALHRRPLATVTSARRRLPWPPSPPNVAAANSTTPTTPSHSNRSGHLRPDLRVAGGRPTERERKRGVEGLRPIARSRHRCSSAGSSERRGREAEEARGLRGREEGGVGGQGEDYRGGEGAEGHRRGRGGRAAEEAWGRRAGSGERKGMTGVARRVDKKGEGMTRTHEWLRRGKRSIGADFMERLYLSRHRQLCAKHSFDMEKYLGLQKHCKCPLEGHYSHGPKFHDL